MAHPVRRLDQRRPLPDRGIGDPHAVWRPAVADVLARRGRRLPARARVRRPAGEIDGVDAHRLAEVLDGVLAQVDEAHVELAVHQAGDLAGDADAAGLGQALQPRGHVDPVAVDVVAVDDDVADVDADAQADAPVLRHLGRPRAHAVLHVDGEGQRVDDAGELHQRPVAHQFDDAAVVLGDLRLDQLPPVRLQRRQRPGLVALHQPAVAGDVGGQNGGEPALHGPPQRGEPSLRTRVGPFGGPCQREPSPRPPEPSPRDAA